MTTKATALKGLNLVQAPVKQTFTPIEKRRHKLLERLEEQKAFVLAVIKDEPFEPTKEAWRKDETTGAKVKVTVPKKVKPWFMEGEGGAWFFTPRYGNKPIELAKGLTAIQVDKQADLPGVVDTLIAAVTIGDLDHIITDMASKTAKQLGK